MPTAPAREVDHFEIDNAVKADGTPAGLRHIDFVKIQTGVHFTTVIHRRTIDRSARCRRTFPSRGASNPDEVVRLPAIGPLRKPTDPTTTSIGHSLSQSIYLGKTNYSPLSDCWSSPPAARSTEPLPTPQVSIEAPAGTDPDPTHQRRAGRHADPRQSGQRQHRRGYLPSGKPTTNRSDEPRSTPSRQPNWVALASST